MIQRVPRSTVTASGDELDHVRLRVLESSIPEGVPRDLAGHFFLVGPVGSVDAHGLPSPSGVPIFNGNGMVYRFDLDAEGGPTVSSKIARTPCYYADRASVRGSRNEALGFRDFGLLRFSAPLGLRNQLNTALLPIVLPGQQPRLLVTYDAGRPYEIDTSTLELATPIGTNAEWAAALPIPFPFPFVLATAHPFHDARTGELFTINFGRSVVNLLAGPLPEAWRPAGIHAALDRAANAGATALFERPGLRKPWHLLRSGLGRARRALRQFIAHPPPPLDAIGRRLESERVRLLELGYDFVHLLRWNGAAIERFEVLDLEGLPIRVEQSMHQMGVTSRYIVLLDSAFKIGAESIVDNPLPERPDIERMLRQALTARQSSETVLYLIPRDDLRPGGGVVRARRVVLPLETVHMLADHDDSGDRITLLCAHNTSADVSEWIRAYDVDPVTGEPSPAHLRGLFALGQADVSRIGRYTIEGSTGRVLDSKIFSDVERATGIGLYAFRDLLPSGELPPRRESVYWQGWGVWSELSTRFIDDLYEGHPHRLFPLERLRAMRADGGRPASIFRLDVRSMTIADQYEFPLREEGCWLGSLQFVPKRGGSGGDTDGYIVTAVNTGDGAEIWVFDGADLAHGPICRLGHPSLTFGVTIHTAWLPSIGPRTHSYVVPARDDYAKPLSLALPHVQSFFDREVFPHLP